MENKIKIINFLASYFQLSKNEIDILKELVVKDLNAKEILERTTVSNGRIYNVLFSLESNGLITSKGFKPKVYSISDFPKNINNFLDLKSKEFIKTQTQISALIETEKNDISVDVVYGTREEFDFELIKMFDAAKWLKIIHKHVSTPWFLYVFDEDKFLKIRGEISHSRVTGSSPIKHNLLQKRLSYLKLYESKNVEHLMQTTVANEFIKMIGKTFGNKEKDNYIKELIKQLKKGDTAIYTLDELFNPFSIYISDNQVIQIMFFGSGQDRIIKMKGKEIVSTYLKFFENYKKDSKNILDLLDKYNL